VAWALLATFMSAFPTMLLQSSARPSSLTWICGGMLIVNVVLNLALIPRYGAHGTAVACVVTEVVGVVLSLPIASRLLVRLPYRDIALRPLLAAAIAAPCLALGPRLGLGLFLIVDVAAIITLDRGGVVADVVRALRAVAHDPFPTPAPTPGPEASDRPPQS
jgi:O-antigen/teichoic acid export membrane protein